MSNNKQRLHLHIKCVDYSTNKIISWWKSSGVDFGYDPIFNKKIYWWVASKIFILNSITYNNWGKRFDPPIKIKFKEK